MFHKFKRLSEDVHSGVEVVVVGGGRRAKGGKEEACVLLRDCFPVLSFWYVAR